MGTDPSYVDFLYERYREGDGGLDESWRIFFQGFEFREPSRRAGQGDEDALKKEFNVFRMIQSYRARGHLLSDTNPIRPRKDRDARISLSHYGLEDGDLDKAFLCGQFIGLGESAKLRDIIGRLESIYCGKIGVEYMHTMDTDIRRWVREKIEEGGWCINYPFVKKRRILQKLNEANVFETFLQSKYIGQKRFSLEGGESIVPGLDAVINRGAELGAREFVVGMGHRGRLNILANIIGKTYEYIFSEFEGGMSEGLDGDGGDVKYHLGFTSVQKALNGEEISLKILPNPSHLEAVGPVVQGYCRSQIDAVYGNDNLGNIVPVIVHGDAALAGQGIVYETLQMSELPAYSTGGTVHLVINNQIGFTTDFHDGRSTQYCTSLAKILHGPIIHVNGDEPEHVVYACELAIEFRQKFQKDVWVDMVCYRKHGHNEGDEPKYTQPHLYGLVAKHKNPRELYIEKLLDSNPQIKELARQVQKEFRDMLSDRLNNVKQKELPKRKQGPHRGWTNLRWSKPEDFKVSPETGVGRGILDRVVDVLTAVPEGFKTLRKAQKILDERKTSYKHDTVDWALGELLAYGSILMEGHNVRFSGQDVIRGTFSHRHAKVFDENTSRAHCGLAHLDEKQGRIHIYNSHLSEYAVLGFEYGYSQGNPWSLNIWEAQFGDFSNGAQIIIDQFISSGEVKWRRMCNVVMLLPHGYEGAGPEHSSARPERYLQLCADNNMIVVNCTTPSQLFHVLRRQMKYPFRKPLVIFSPKSLLRDGRCVSSVGDLEKGGFREIIVETVDRADAIKKVLFCTGKIYYLLREKKQQEARDDITIVRIEQLYPLEGEAVIAVKKMFPNASYVWVQEEPSNMGFWSHFARWPKAFKNFRCVARKESASPATGCGTIHGREQQQLVEKAFK